MSLRAALNRCKPITVTPRSPVRHVKASYPSSATRDIPAQTTPSFPEVAVENTATVSKADVVLNANATELETRCDESGALKTKEKVVDSVHPEPKHQSVPTNHSVLGVENQSTYTLKQLLQMLMQQNRKPEVAKVVCFQQNP